VAQMAQRAARTLDRVGSEDRFARGRKPRRSNRAGGALRLRVEALDRQDHVAQKLEPERLGRVGRPHVDDAATDREAARILDDGGAEIARGRQKLGGALEIQLGVRRELEAGTYERL